MYGLLDTSKVPADLRLYLPLLLEAFFESPITRDGKIIPYEDVVTELNNDTVLSGGQLGLSSSQQKRFTCGSYAQTASFLLQVESAKYEKGLNWMREILYQTVFTAERLKIIATKMINEVAQAKRSGRNVVAYAMRGMRYKEGLYFCVLGNFENK